MLILALAIAMPAIAEDEKEPAAASSRLEVWKTLREEKAQRLQPERRNKLENALFEFKERRILERFQAGFHGIRPKLGGFETGSGFGMGAEARPRLFDGLLDARVSAQASLKGYQRYEAGISLPRLADERFFVNVDLSYRNSPQQDFFGLGAESQEADRTSFRYEAAEYAATFGVRPIAHVETGAAAGILRVRTGAGTDPRFPSIEEIFDDGEAPGLGAQPDYAYAALFARVDTRDRPGNPRSGGAYAVEWKSYGDIGDDGYGFDRFNVEAEHYFSFFNERRVIAVRAQTSLAHTRNGNRVPYFMQPALGGSEDLRGFREFRFRDRNLLGFNLEYRWEAFSGLDLALFGDAGKVFETSKEFGLDDLKTSYGFGLRFNTAESVFWRIDTGFGREGPRLFLKFGHVF